MFQLPAYRLHQITPPPSPQISATFRESTILQRRRLKTHSLTAANQDLQKRCFWPAPLGCVASLRHLSSAGKRYGYILTILWKEPEHTFSLPAALVANDRRNKLSLLKCGRPLEMITPFCATGTGVKAVFSVVSKIMQSGIYGDT